MQIDKQEEKHNIEAKLREQHLNNPPASSSSPSHEFTFTISSTAKTPPEKNKSAPPFAAIDLSPADEIFFHGHLLPLHLLSHLPISPRSSTNSFDSFTLPIKELSQHNNNYTTTTSSSYDHHQHIKKTTSHSQESIDLPEGAKPRAKTKPFSSLFGLPRWRKISTHQEDDDENDDHNNREKKKSRFDTMMSHVMQRYIMRLIKLSFMRSKSRSGTTSQMYRQPPFSFSSSNLRVGSKKGFLRGIRREGLSAPASIRTSPTNSGLLVGSGSLTPTTSNSDSTMEELQAAIQAAIAHCKNSIATQDHIELKCHN